MLTISAPIDIKAKSTYFKDPEAFYHRIIGNYSLMETRVTSEDLLHITATPPEIYVSEAEGMTSILSTSERNETNINKVDILNNVMNRILVSADVGLTYQDRVFITDALYKMGIRDDRRFMESFYQMAQETKNTNTLINLYLDRGEALRELVERIESSQKELTRKEESTLERERENYLYNSVLDRLKTGAIYQIVSNFNRTVEENEIDANEYSLSNQSYTAQHILLSILRDRAGVSTENLTFLSSNTYEESLLSEETDITNVKNEMTSAVMMDLLKNIYHTAYDRFYTAGDTYYRFEDTFYGASDQTFIRLLNNLQTDFQVNRILEEYVVGSVSQEAADIEFPEAVSQLELTEEDIRRISEITSVSDITNNERLKDLVTQTRKQIEIRNLLNETSRFTSTDLELLRRVEEGHATEEDIRRVKEIVTYSGIRNEERIRDVLEQNIQTTRSTDVINENNRLTSTEIELLEKGEEGTMTEEEIKRITETVNRMNIQNERRRQHYVNEIRRIRSEQPPVDNGANTFQQTRQDAVLALSDPQKLMEQLEARNEVRVQRQNTIINELRNIFPDQTTEVYQILSRLREGDVNIIENNIARPADLGELIYDINTAGEPSEAERKARIKAEKEQEEIRKALESVREQEKAVTAVRRSVRTPVETIHRQSETLTTEELNEQLNMMQSNLNKQMNKTVQNEVVTENRVVHQTQVVQNETQQTQLRRRDIEQLIENGVKSQMSTISNQVMNKIERQMKNDKMRRGF